MCREDVNKNRILSVIFFEIASDRVHAIPPAPQNYRSIRSKVSRASSHKLTWLLIQYSRLKELTFYSLPVMWCTSSLTFNNCTLRPHYIYVFCIYLRTNSDLCHLQHKLIGFYNRDEKCLQRGTDWGFKYSGLRLVFKGFKSFNISTS